MALVCNIITYPYCNLKHCAMMSHLCNRYVRELLILARTWFTFGLPSKTGCDISGMGECCGALIRFGTSVRLGSDLGFPSAFDERSPRLWLRSFLEEPVRSLDPWGIQKGFRREASFSYAGRGAWGPTGVPSSHRHRSGSP